MRKYQPDKLKEVMDTYNSYGPIVQTLALMNEGWEAGQILKYFVESQTGIILAKPLPEIRIKKVKIVKRYKIK